jgi:hypothetical protein
MCKLAPTVWPARLFASSRYKIESGVSRRVDTMDDILRVPWHDDALCVHLIDAGIIRIKDSRDPSRRTSPSIPTRKWASVADIPRFFVSVKKTTRYASFEDFRSINPLV